MHEVRIVHVPHRLEPGQPLRVLDAEDLRVVVVAVDQQHVAAVVALVDRVHHHVEAGGQRAADVVVGEIRFLAEVLDAVLRKPAAHQRDVAQIVFEPVGLLSRPAGGIRQAAPGAGNPVGQRLQERLVDVSGKVTRRNRPVLQMMDDVGTALKTDQRVDAAAGDVILVRLGDVEQVLLREMRGHVDPRIRRLERRDAGKRPARSAAPLAGLELRLKLKMRNHFRQRRAAGRQLLRCWPRNERHAFEARNEGFQWLDQRRRDGIDRRAGEWTERRQDVRGVERIVSGRQRCGPGELRIQHRRVLGRALACGQRDPGVASDAIACGCRHGTSSTLEC